MSKFRLRRMPALDPSRVDLVYWARRGAVDESEIGGKSKTDDSETEER